MADRRIGGAGGGSDPGPGKGSAGGIVVAGTLAIALASGSGGMGAVSSGTAGSVAGESAVSGPAGPAGQNVASRIAKKRKVDAKRSVRRGRVDEAWQRVGVRRLRQSNKVSGIDCVAHSFGKVRKFLLRMPCKSLDRILYVVGDERGNSAVVSVAWVEFRNRGSVWKFQRLEDRHGTGDIKPLGGFLLGIRDIEFTGHHYDAEPRGNTLAIAEAETLSGTYSADDLDTITEVAALIPRP